ncbi:MAG: DNA/RNA nuclease SfsA [Eggerthellaceae bacterium]|nr:DNA/RNA nuclease SfsA [Eggerthellaceae bacterium]
MKDFMFDPPLSEGVIVRRKSQFTMTVLFDGEEQAFHCPTTGRIGNLDVAGRPCLVSLAKGEGRKAAGTVEAVSLARPEDAGKQWIGINQNAANRYVEHFLRNGGFADIVGAGHEDDVRREVFLGESKLDFLVGDVFLEVKTPLQHLQVNVPEWVKTKKVTPFSSTGRMQRHVGELAKSLADHQRAIFLTCFIYDNPGFEVVEKSTNYDEVKRDMDAAQVKDVEIWQANFRLTPEKVALDRYFRISV